MMLLRWLSYLWGWVSANAEPLAVAATFGASLAALAIVVVTFLSVRQMKRAAYAQVLLEMTERFASSEMLRSMRDLREFERRYGEDFPHVLQEFIESDSPEGHDLNVKRRYVTHYFHNVIMLLKAKVIDKKTLKTMIFPYQAEYLFEVIEPLEKIRIGYKDVMYMFDEYRKLFPQSWRAVEARRLS